MEFLNSLLPYFGEMEYLAYLLAFLFAAAEATIGMSMLVPGSLSIMLLGALSALGAFKIYILLPVAVLGAIVGDNISYFLGSRFGRRFVKKVKIIDEKTLSHAEEFIKLHGAKSVFLGRFVPFAKETVPFVAGTLNMDRKKFFLYNVFGAIGWSIAWPGTGYVFAKAVLSGNEWVGFAQMFLALIIFSYLSYFLFKDFILKRFEFGFSKILSKILKNKTLRNTLLFISLAYIFFILLAISVLENLNFVHFIDFWFFENLYLHFNAFLFLFLFFITWSAKWYVVLFFLFLLSLYFWKKRWYAEICALFFAVLGSAFATQVLKHVIARSRPDYHRVLEDGFAFPSGHAASAVSLAGILIFLIVKRKVKHAGVLIFSLVLWAALISASRIYLGVHYFTDILGGALVAFVFVAGATSLWSFCNEKINKKNE